MSKSLIGWLRFDLEEGTGLSRALRLYFTSPGFNVVMLFRLSQLFGGFFSQIVTYRNLRRNGAEISPHAKIGRGLRIGHPNGIVIGKHVVAGRNLTLFQHVTLGQIGGKYPRIGDNVRVYLGSSVLGDIVIGDNVVIGAHCLVQEDVASGTVVVASDTIQKSARGGRDTI